MLKNPERNEWLQAIDNEIENMVSMGVWNHGDITDTLPEKERAIDSTWAFAKKADENFYYTFHVFVIFYCTQCIMFFFSIRLAHDYYCTFNYFIQFFLFNTHPPRSYRIFKFTYIKAKSLHQAHSIFLKLLCSPALFLSLVAAVMFPA